MTDITNILKDKILSVNLVTSLTHKEASKLYDLIKQQTTDIEFTLKDLLCDNITVDEKPFESQTSLGFKRARIIKGDIKYVR